MRANELLAILQRYEDIGVDLSKADVVVEYTEYTRFDLSEPFYIGIDERVYPDGVCIRQGELIIGREE